MKVTVSSATPFELLGQKCHMVDGVYDTGRTAIRIISGGLPFAVLTVNLPDDPLEDGEIFVKTWSENAAIREPILALGIFEDTGKRVPTGFTEAEVWRFKP